MVFGSLADILLQWEALGVFDFLLPFLLVFAIVYAVLTATNMLGGNRGVAVIIALVIGLMSLRYRFFFSDFISELFPRLGIGLAVLLTVLILVGVFVADKERRYWGYGLAAIGVVIAITIIYQSFNRLGYWPIGGFGTDAVGFIILAVLLVGIIIAVSVSGGRRETDKEPPGFVNYTPWRGSH